MELFMKLRAKAIMLSLLLIPMVSVAGSNPSYSQRFGAWMSSYARQAASPQSTYLLPESGNNRARPVVQHAPEEVVQAYKEAEEIDDRIIDAEADLMKAKADFKKASGKERKKLAKIVTEKREQLASLGREGKMKHDIFKAEAEKAREAGLLSAGPGGRFVEGRPDKEEPYGFALARGIRYANIARLTKEAEDANARMFDAGADAVQAGTPAAYAAAEKAKQDYQVSKLALLKEEESLAGMRAGDARVRVMEARVGGRDATQAMGEAQVEDQEYKRLRETRAAVAAQVEQNKQGAAKRAPALSQWWNRSQAGDTSGQTLRERLRQQEARDAAERLQRDRWNPAGY
jgi:hypothetical protein